MFSSTKKTVKRILHSGDFPSFREIGEGLDEVVDAADNLAAAAEDFASEMDGFIEKHESWTMEKLPDRTVLNIQVPGLSRDNIIVTTQGHSITVVQKALRRSVDVDGFVVPANQGSTRRWNFTTDYDMDKVKVRCRDGILCVVVPRKLKEERVHTVKVG